MCDLCFRGSTGICSGQLCFQVTFFLKTLKQNLGSVYHLNCHSNRLNNWISWVKISLIALQIKFDQSKSMLMDVTNTKEKFFSILKQKMKSFLGGAKLGWTQKEQIQQTILKKTIFWERKARIQFIILVLLRILIEKVCIIYFLRNFKDYFLALKMPFFSCLVFIGWKVFQEKESPLIDYLGISNLINFGETLG